MDIREWVAIVEIATFLVLLGTILWNRHTDYQKTKLDMVSLKESICNVQKSMDDYTRACIVCRTAVQVHHEDAGRHITVEMRDQLRELRADVTEIKRYLLEGKK
jgi:hypothetical protein